MVENSHVIGSLKCILKTQTPKYSPCFTCLCSHKLEYGLLASGNSQCNMNAEGSGKFCSEGSCLLYNQANKKYYYTFMVLNRI